MDILSTIIIKCGFKIEKIAAINRVGYIPTNYCFHGSKSVGAIAEEIYIYTR